MPASRTTKLDAIVDSIEGVDEVQSEKAELLKTGQQKDDDTRQKVARFFVRAYFVLLGLILISVPAYNWLVYRGTQDGALLLSLKDTVLTYSAVVGPTMGLVVAYYFENKNRHD